MATNGDTVTLTVDGPDKGAVRTVALVDPAVEAHAFTFLVDGDGTTYTLAVGDAAKIDFETKSEYLITIVATDANANDEERTPMTESIDVKITVNNLEEAGTVTLSQTQLQVGVPVTASLKDPDDSISTTRWQWSAQAVVSGTTCPEAADPLASDSEGGWIAIKGATGATYTPLATHADSNAVMIGDQAMCLQATASYLDAVKNVDADDAPITVDADTTFLDDRKDIANGVSSAVEPKTTGNAAPTFGKEDVNDDQVQEDGSAENPFLRSVDENKNNEPVGSPLGSSDTDDDDLIHSIEGPDADSFSIAPDTGQISVKGSLDFEARSEYMVMVRATDPSLASGMAMVMITVNDKDDSAEITLRPTDNVAPMFADDAETDFMVYENMDGGRRGRDGNG